MALESDPVTVRGIGKGDQERALPLHQRAVDELRQYIFHVRPKMVRNRNEPALFVNRRGGRLTRQGFWLILKNYAREAGLDGITPAHPAAHLRHAHALGRECRCGTCRRRSGHASISTTQIYTQLTDQQKREQYDRAHPRA